MDVDFGDVRTTLKETNARLEDRKVDIEEINEKNYKQ